MTLFNTSCEIAAPIEQVFAAFSDAKRLARWWGPAGFTNTFKTFEFKAGGQWLFIMHGPDGQNYPNENMFADIVEPKKIVIKHTSEPHFVLTIEMTPCDNGTLLTWSQNLENDEVAEKLRPMIEPCNEQNLQRLTNEVLRGVTQGNATVV